MNIWNCRSLSNYDEFLIHLEKETKEGLRKDIFASDLTQDTLVKKIFELHQKHLSAAHSPDEISEVYLETLATLSHLKKVLVDPRLKKIIGRSLKLKESKQIAELERSCISKTRQNPETMERIIDRYNLLVDRCLNSTSDKPPPGVFEELQFLNSYIGIPWTAAEQIGNKIAPKWSLEGTATPQNDLKACETVSDLLGYVQQLNSPVSEELKRTVFEKLIPFYEKEKREEPYSPIPLAFQTSRAISLLNLLETAPAKKRLLSRKKRTDPNLTMIKDIETECISTLRKTNQGKTLIMEKWNALARQVNQELRAQLFGRPEQDLSDTERIKELHHLASCADFSLSREQLKGKAFLPEYLDLNLPAEEKRAIETYQSYAVWVNEENRLREMLEERDHLKKQLSENRLHTGSLKESILERRKARLEHLEEELLNWPPQLDDRIFESLFVIARDLGESLEVLRDEHVQGEKPLPLFGREIPFGKKKAGHLLYLNPTEWRDFCIKTDLYNNALLGYEKKSVHRELISQSENDTLTYEEFDKKRMWLESQKKEAVLDQPPERRRKMQQFFADLLLKNAGFRHHPFPSKEQFEGKERWPVPDWKHPPPLPDSEVLQEELRSILTSDDPFFLTEVVKKLPDSWKDAVQSEIRKMFTVRQSPD